MEGFRNNLTGASGLEADVLVIAGPTATGKTETSIHIARQVDCEIISADAFQVYCYMDIGTAKPDLYRRIDPCHHMIDVCMPDRNFSVADYRRHAEKCLKGILERGRKALVVGGTPLYITALVFDIEIPEERKIPGLRESLIEQYRTRPESLVKKLGEIDPDALKIIDARNPRRLIRAIELFEQSGVRYSELYRRWKLRKPAYNSLILWLYREREEIYKAIEKRVDRMIELGLVDEVRFLKENFNLSATARQAIGYREILSYLEGRISFEDAVQETKRRTRNYAKKQISWFKNDINFIPVDVSGLTSEEAAEKILNRYIYT